MNKGARVKHVVITPCRDEQEHIKTLAKSMKDQENRPDVWIIVDDNSTDDSADILSLISEDEPWIRTIHISDSSVRKRGAHIAKLFNQGLNSIDDEWFFCSKIDADMVLPENYFTSIFLEFFKNESLGIASGSCFYYKNNKKITEKVSKEHTRGGLKTYKKQCLDDIGGVLEVDGWDGMDNIMAQMNGWETRNFPSIEAHHRRPTGSYYNVYVGCFEAGQFSYSMRYYPPFILARSIVRMIRRPYIFGGIMMILGYFAAFLSRRKSIGNKEAIVFLRNKQKKRLLFWKKDRKN